MWKPYYILAVLLTLACSPKASSPPAPEAATTPANGTNAGITHIEARKSAERQDSDQDGANNWVDNCLQTPNPDQADGDGDGWGDACDRCPETDGKTGAHGCPIDKVPCVDACTETQECDKSRGDCVDLPPPRIDRPDGPWPVEECHKYCDIFAEYEELEKACGKPGAEDFRGRCHTMCVEDEKGREQFQIVSRSGANSSSTMQGFVDLSSECVCGSHYCPMIMKNCSGDDSVFKSEQECYDTCNTYRMLGGSGALTGDSIRCRINHAWKEGEWFSCEKASPDSSVCRD
jgi:hypothetical protein